MKTKIIHELLSASEKIRYESILLKKVDERTVMFDKTEESINSLSGQKIFEINNFPFRYSTGLVPQST